MERTVFGALRARVAWRRAAATLFLSCALTTASPATAAAPPPLEAFGRLADVQYVAMAPNGRLLAYDELQKGRLVVFDADTGQTRRIITVDPANKLRDLEWADDETLLVTVSTQKAVPCESRRRCKAEWFRTLALHMDGSPPLVLLNDEGTRRYVTGSRLLAARTGRPGSVTMETLDHAAGRERQNTGSHMNRSDRENTGWASVVFDVDTRTGKDRPLASGSQYTLDWVVDAAGLPVARAEWYPDRELYLVAARQGESWKEIYRREDGQTLSLPGLHPDGTAIVALGAIDTPRSQAWRMPLDGSAVQLLHADPFVDVDFAYVDEHTRAVVGLSGPGLEKGIVWLDSKRGSQQRALEAAFPGRRVTVQDRSADGKRLLVMIESGTQPPVFQLVDFERSRADIVAESYPSLTPAVLGSVRFFHYPARDGVPIPAYLTLPPGSDGKQLPTVILPHGGPESRDTGDFDWLAQFLATRGYAVMQPQFRGSTGFGEQFRLAGYRQWGRLMQDDVTDGVRHLVAEGISDPARVCIVGGSYGGYAALAGAAYTPELYACAVSINGVSDLPAMVLAAERWMGEDSNAASYWVDHIGQPSDPNVIGRSPARSAQSVRAPILLLHGAEDAVVPYSQSETMERALRKYDKPVNLVQLPGEDHWLSRSQTRVRVLQELEKFLAANLKK